jgi:hypothetical protein
MHITWVYGDQGLPTNEENAAMNAFEVFMSEFHRLLAGALPEKVVVTAESDPKWRRWSEFIKPLMKRAAKTENHAMVALLLVLLVAASPAKPKDVFISASDGAKLHVLDFEGREQSVVLRPGFRKQIRARARALVGGGAGKIRDGAQASPRLRTPRSRRR